MKICPEKTNKEAIFFEHGQLVLALSAAAVILCLCFFDIPIAEFFHTFPSAWRRSLKFLTNLIDPKYNNYVWPLVFFLFRYLLKKQVWGNRILLVLISIPLGNFFVWILKFIFGRARPDLLFSKHLYGFHFFEWNWHLESFPSGHAAGIGAICGAFACFYPRLSALFLVVGFSLALTRVGLGVHFLSDVIAGFTIGLLIAQWTYILMKEQKTRFYHSSN